MSCNTGVGSWGQRNSLRLLVLFPLFCTLGFPNDISNRARHPALNSASVQVAQNDSVSLCPGHLFIVMAASGGIRLVTKNFSVLP